MTTRTRIRSGDGDLRHGTRNGYTNLRCRCSLCRRAWADYVAALRSTRVPPPLGDPRHGSESTRTNYRCMCLLCRQAHVDYQRQAGR